MGKKGKKKSRMLKRAIKRAEKRINVKVYKRIAELQKDPIVMAEIDQEIEDLIALQNLNLTNGKKRHLTTTEILHYGADDKQANPQSCH